MSRPARWKEELEVLEEVNAHPVTEGLKEALRECYEQVPEQTKQALIRRGVVGRNRGIDYLRLRLTP